MGNVQILIPAKRTITSINTRYNNSGIINREHSGTLWEKVPENM